MYDPNSHKSFSNLNPYMQVRLDRQQEMPQSELRRQQMYEILRDKPKARTFRESVR